MLNKSVDYVTMYYNYTYDEFANVTNVHIRERILKRASKFVWNGAIHEEVNVSGKGVGSHVYINHAHEAQSISDAKVHRNFEILDNLIKNGDESLKTLYYYGLSLAELGQADEALKYLNKFLSVMPDNFQYGFFAYTTAHKLYFKKGDLENALKTLTDNEEKFKHKSEFYCTLGFFYRDVYKDLDKASECFTKALSCTGIYGKGKFVSHRDETYYYFMPYYSLGKCQITLGKHAEALESFKKALEYNNTHEQTKLLVEKLEKLVQLYNLQNSVE